MDFDVTMTALKALEDKLAMMGANASSAHKVWFNDNVALLQLTQKALNEFVEPWICSSCQLTRKFPPSPQPYTLCPKCQTKTMLPYGYHQVKTQDGQIRKMLDGLKGLTTKENKLQVQEILNSL